MRIDLFFITDGRLALIQAELAFIDVQLTNNLVKSFNFNIRSLQKRIFQYILAVKRCHGYAKFNHTDLTVKE